LGISLKNNFSINYNKSLSIENSVSYMTSRTEFSIWIILKISHTNHRIIHNYSISSTNHKPNKKDDKEQILIEKNSINLSYSRTNSLFNRI